MTVEKKWPNGLPQTLIILTATLLVANGEASQSLNVPLSDLTRVEASRALDALAIDVTQSRAQAPLEAAGWEDISAVTGSTPFSVGDGSHGVFDSTTYIHFHDGVYANDKIIRINTETYPDLNFTSFNLEDGWQILPVGSKPLIIRSLSNVIISGKIDCSGGAGAAMTDEATAPAGGVGRCGGWNGGRGQSIGLAAAAGQASGVVGDGTAGGAATGVAASGGGGGGGMNSYGPGTTGAGAGGGAAGNAGTDDHLLVIGGGAGGGGGGHSAATTSSGGGGGAGGGSIYIYAMTDIRVLNGTLTNGEVRANGGAGGVAPDLIRKGGGGGAGAGGTVVMLAGGRLIVQSNTAITADPGATATVVGGNDGGPGGAGRTWTIDALGNVNNAAGANIGPGSAFANNEGAVKARTGNFTLVSKLIDLGSAGAELTAASLDSTLIGGSTVTLEVAAAAESFIATEDSWKPATSLSGMSGKRYLRLRIKMNNLSAASPAVVRSATLAYELRERNQFEFASCQSVTSAGAGGGAGLVILLMLLPLMTATALKLSCGPYQSIPNSTPN